MWKPSGNTDDETLTKNLIKVNALLVQEPWVLTETPTSAVEL